MTTKYKKKATAAVMILGSIGVIAGASLVAAILAKKSLKSEEGKEVDVKEDDQGGSVNDDDETKANAGDAIVTIESQPYTIEDVFLRTGNTFLTIWNTRVSCNATTAGDSETLSLTPSIDVDGAYYIKSMQGQYLAADGNGVVYITSYNGQDQSWFIKPISTDGRVFIQARSGGFVTKSIAFGSKLASTGKSFLVIKKPLLPPPLPPPPQPDSDDDDVDDDDGDISGSETTDTSTTKIPCSLRVIGTGGKYLSISSAGWINFNAATVGVEEKIQLVPIENRSGYYYIESSYGQYVSVNSDGSLVLTAVPDGRSVWQLADPQPSAQTYVFSPGYGYYIYRDLQTGSAKTTKIPVSSSVTQVDSLFIIARLSS